MLLAACGSREGQGGAAPGAGAGAPPPAEVNVITVTQGAATLTTDLPGRLEAYRISQVRARVDGIVERRLFTEGSDVKGGDTLFQIDARTYRTAYESSKIDVDVARQTLERYKPLLEAKAVSQQDYDLANAKVKQAEAALAKAALDLENCRVPAPISGRIGRALVTEGALVGHGDATNLATIQQIDPIYANFTQPGADLSRLQKAIAGGELKHATSTEVELVLEDGSIYPQKGKLLFSDIAVDPSTGSVSIRATFPNPRKELLPGMFAMVRLPQAISDEAIRLPQRAVMVGPQGQFVLAVDAENKVVPRPVKTVAMAGGDFIVGSGVVPGDLVIVDGVQKARPGSVVKPVPLEPAENAAESAPAAAAQMSPEKK
jgi:membrane fusion protein (multidrug efflux system)